MPVRTKQNPKLCEAGQFGRDHVATNMRRRGTEFALDDAARAAGGLMVDRDGRHDAHRSIGNFYGRFARHGDPAAICTLCR